MNVDSFRSKKKKRKRKKKRRRSVYSSDLDLLHMFMYRSGKISYNKWNEIAGYVVQQPLKTPCYVLGKQSTQ